MSTGKNEKSESIIKQLTQPFIDLAHTSRALFGVNFVYVIEGICYFGVVGLLAIYFNEYIGLNDISAGRMVGVLTGGITLAMLFLGATVDWIGVRKAFLVALIFMSFFGVRLGILPVSGGDNEAYAFDTICYGGSAGC